MTKKQEFNLKQNMYMSTCRAPTSPMWVPEMTDLTLIGQPGEKVRICKGALLLRSQTSTPLWLDLPVYQLGGDFCQAMLEEFVEASYCNAVAFKFPESVKKIWKKMELNTWAEVQEGHNLTPQMSGMLEIKEAEINQQQHLTLRLEGEMGPTSPIFNSFIPPPIDPVVAKKYLDAYYMPNRGELLLSDHPRPAWDPYLSTYNDVMPKLMKWSDEIDWKDAMRKSMITENTKKYLPFRALDPARVVTLAFVMENSHLAELGFVTWSNQGVAHLIELQTGAKITLDPPAAGKRYRAGYIKGPSTAVEKAAEIILGFGDRVERGFQFEDSAKCLRPTLHYHVPLQYFCKREGQICTDFLPPNCVNPGATDHPENRLGHIERTCTVLPQGGPRIPPWNDRVSLPQVLAPNIKDLYFILKDRQRRMKRLGASFAFHLDDPLLEIMRSQLRNRSEFVKYSVKMHAFLIKRGKHCYDNLIMNQKTGMEIARFLRDSPEREGAAYNGRRQIKCECDVTKWDGKTITARFVPLSIAGVEYYQAEASWQAEEDHKRKIKEEAAEEQKKKEEALIIKAEKDLQQKYRPATINIPQVLKTLQLPKKKPGSDVSTSTEDLAEPSTSAQAAAREASPTQAERNQAVQYSMDSLYQAVSHLLDQQEEMNCDRRLEQLERKLNQLLNMQLQHRADHPSMGPRDMQARLEELQQHEDTVRTLRQAAQHSSPESYETTREDDSMFSLPSNIPDERHYEEVDSDDDRILGNELVLYDRISDQSRRVVLQLAPGVVIEEMEGPGPRNEERARPSTPLVDTANNMFDELREAHEAELIRREGVQGQAAHLEELDAPEPRDQERGLHSAELVGIVANFVGELQEAYENEFTEHEVVDEVAARHMEAILPMQVVEQEGVSEESGEPGIEDQPQGDLEVSDPFEEKMEQDKPEDE